MTTPTQLGIEHILTTKKPNVTQHRAVPSSGTLALYLARQTPKVDGSYLKNL